MRDRVHGVFDTKELSQPQPLRGAPRPGTPRTDGGPAAVNASFRVIEGDTGQPRTIDVRSGATPQPRSSGHEHAQHHPGEPESSSLFTGRASLRLAGPRGGGCCSCAPDALRARQSAKAGGWRPHVAPGPARRRPSRRRVRCVSADAAEQRWPRSSPRERRQPRSPTGAGSSWPAACAATPASSRGGGRSPRLRVRG